ncbi:MAG: FkbM family methyltransferase [Rubrivivax sp.]|nr:MAG: FkbM family methyltransferase [Rubrivivax sp.]
MSFTDNIFRLLDYATFHSASLFRLRLFRLFPRDYIEFMAWCHDHRELMAASQSQIAQDLVALYILDQKLGVDIHARSNRFVEFGAFDGQTHSNSWVMEKVLGWDGTLVEPDPKYAELARSKRAAAVINACVSSRTGDQVTFSVCKADGELSGVTRHIDAARLGETVELSVSTLSLDDLVAGQDVAVLSVDTEGSEYEILSGFSFSNPPRVIIVEHNYSRLRRDIRVLLTGKGYTRYVRRGNYFDDIYYR